MERHRIKQAPVLDGDSPGAIFSRANLRRALAGARRRSHSDHRRHPEARLRRAGESGPGAARRSHHCRQERGSRSQQSVLDEKEREALRVAAENLPGVKAVEDHLVWVKPASGTVIDPPQKERMATKP